MGRKRSAIFHKLSLSLLMHKFRKPIITKLLTKLKKRQEMKLMRRYSYGEYQFSESSTPLIHPKQFKNRGSGHPGLCSFLYLYCCLGNFKVESSGDCHLPPSPTPFQIQDALQGEDLSDEAEGESVDEKAERFIQTFYHQIRMQTHHSL